MPPNTVQSLIDNAASHWSFSPDIEITLEANPSSVEAARFRDLATVGVNRVSLGLQALEDEALAFLGRAHDVAEGLGALDTAQRAFDRVSFDLIYARPDQDQAAWESELRRAIGFGTDHVSLYQLTIEPGTRFAALAAKGMLAEYDPDRAADLFELTRAVTAEAGLPAYEVSNHARPGQESRHNLTYWRYGDYLGVGPGAHGRRDEVATFRRRKPENFLAAVTRNGHGIEGEEALSPETQAEEALLMGLRLKEGVEVKRVESAIDPRAAAQLEQQGLLSRTGERLFATPAGMLVLNRLIAELAA